MDEFVRLVLPLLQARCRGATGTLLPQAHFAVVFQPLTWLSHFSFCLPARTIWQPRLARHGEDLARDRADQARKEQEELARVQQVEAQARARRAAEEEAIQRAREEEQARMRREEEARARLRMIDEAAHHSVLPDEEVGFLDFAFWPNKTNKNLTIIASLLFSSFLLFFVFTSSF